MTYEHSFADMTSPERRDYRHTVFMGILDSDKPASVRTVRELKEAVEARIKPLEDRLERVEGALTILTQIANSILQTTGARFETRGNSTVNIRPVASSSFSEHFYVAIPAAESSDHPAAHPFAHSAAVFASILHPASAASITPSNSAAPDTTCTRTTPYTASKQG
jgi:hypothetical protein